MRTPVKSGAPLVTIVMPNYNHARYLGAALDSVLAQTYGHWEVVLVDDGSTDDSANLIAKYATKMGMRLHAILQDNQGLSAARNHGVGAAQGDYIALLDADDLLEPDYLARMVQHLCAHPEDDGVYCGFRFVDQDNCALPQSESRPVKPDDLFSALLMGNYWVPESLLAKRACYAAMGKFDTHLRACEDWDVWLRFSRNYRLVGIPDCLIRYRVVVGSMSSDPVRMLDNRLAVLAKHVGARPAQAGRSEAHAAYANAYLRTGIEYLQMGDAKAAYPCLHTAVRIYPTLLMQTPVFYELACGSQGKGQRGEWNSLDLRRTGEDMLVTVHRLLAEPDVRVLVDGQAAKVESCANVALGMLCYNRGDAAAARRAYLRAGTLNPRLWGQPTFWGRLARSAVGVKTITRLRRPPRLP